MTKRRRSKSLESRSSDGDKKRTSLNDVNPFLPEHAEESSEVSKKYTAILDHAIAFDDLSKAKTISDDLAAHVNGMISFLKEPSSDPSLSSLATDLALLMLPWSVRSLLSSKSDTSTHRLYWESLPICLERIAATDDLRALELLSRSILNQSNLHKLVPQVTSVALSSAAESEEEITTTGQSTTAKKSISSLAARALPLILAKYRPTVETACQAILPLLAEPEATGDAVVLNILKWISSLLQTANPKTVFQLFSSRSVLLNLSKIYYMRGTLVGIRDAWQGEENSSADENPVQSAVRNLLSSALFSSKHHLEGLCSLLSTVDSPSSDDNAGNSFQCYQQKLLATIGTLSEAPTDDCETGDDDIHYLVMLCPVLLQVFYRESTAWGRNKTSKGALTKSSASARLARAQFNLFRQTVVSLERFDDGQDPSVTSSRIHAIRLCLALLLKFEVYLPSQDDKQSSQFQFLERLGHKLLSGESATGTSRSICTLAPTLAGLRLAMSLDHRTFSSRLVDVFSFCLGCGAAQLTEGVVKVFAGAVDIHRQLRQQADLFEALVTLLDVISSRKDSEQEFELVLGWLHHESVEHSIAEAADSCPFGQFEQVFDLFRSRAESLLKKPTHDHGALAVVASLAAMVLRSIKVEKDNALAISSMCNGFMRSLVGNSTDVSHLSKRKAVQEMSAWCIELTTRASFWTGRSGEARIPETLLVARGATSTEADGDCENDSNERLLLLGHRMRELHSLLYESERLEDYEGTSLESARATLAQEAVDTAAKIATIADTYSEDDVGHARWAFVARHFWSYWLPYGSDVHVDRMLHWLFITLSSCDETDAATGLLSDATFYESASVTSRLTGVALENADKWIQRARSLTTASAKKSSTDSDSLETYLRRAAIPVLVVNDVFRENSGFMVNHHDAQALALALRIDEQVLVFANMPALVESATSLCGNLRYLAARHVADFSREDTRDFLERLDLKKEILRLIESASSLSLAVSANESPLLDGSGILVARLLHLMTEKDAIGSSFQEVLLKVFEFTTKSEAMASIGRHVLKEILKFDSRNPEFFDSLFHWIWNIVVQSGERLMEASEEIGDCPTSMDCIFLFGDLVRFAHAQSVASDHWSRPDIKKFIEDVCITNISTTKPLQCAQYVVACLARIEEAPAQASRLMEQIALSPKQSALMDGTFSHLIRHTTEEQLRIVVRMLIEQIETSTDAANQIRLIKLCFMSANENFGTRVLSDFARKIFSAVLSPLAQRPVVLGASLASCSVLEDLLGSRQVFTFRDVDLTRLLYHISAAVGYNGPPESMTALPTQIYTSCTKLYVTAFQRYTKYLYSCAPLVILVVQTFLARVLYEPDLTDDIVNDRAQRFVRVCELFVDHKEIYKKHVLALILEYIQATQNNLSLVRKGSLLPAIHLLLDTLASHELKQLNTMLDPSATIFFRGVYHNYQKVHAYKGK